MMRLGLTKCVRTPPGWTLAATPKGAHSRYYLHHEREEMEAGVMRAMNNGIKTKLSNEKKKKQTRRLVT